MQDRRRGFEDLPEWLQGVILALFLLGCYELLILALRMMLLWGW